MKNNRYEIAYPDKTEQDNDPEAFIHTMMKWHFSRETGTNFWLNLADKLDFDPIRDIKTFKDLKKFPDVSSRLRTVPVEELIPNGLKELPMTPAVYESGGTTGDAKFFIIYAEWISAMADWLILPYKQHSANSFGKMLAAVPTGPHLVGEITRMKAQKLGSLCFSVDLDPRWVKHLAHEGHYTESNRYIDHILGQIQHIVLTQDIEFLFTTPPLFSKIVTSAPILERLEQTLAYVTLTGTEINLDEVQQIAENKLPRCRFYANYGSTSALGPSRSEQITPDSTRIEYESFSPFITYDVINNETRDSVETGERGTVTVSHISRYAFYPHILERDTGTRLPPRPDSFGACVADISPRKILNGAKIIEGVY